MEAAELTWSIINVYMLHVVEECALLARERRQMTTVNVLPTAFQKFQKILTLEWMVECVWEQQNKERNAGVDV